MMAKHIVSILALVALTGCLTIFGDGNRTGNYQGPKVQKILSLEVDPPAVSDLSSGREAMESVLKLNAKPLAKDPVFIPLYAHDLETAYLNAWAAKKSFKLSVDSHEFEGAKPADVTKWMKEYKPGYDYVSEVSVKKWGVRKHPQDDTRRVVYVSLVHNISGAQTGKVYASHTCVKDTSAAAVADAPSAYELLRNDRVRLKSMMGKLILECMDDIAAKKGA